VGYTALFTNHYLLLAAYCLLLTAYCLLLTAYCLPQFRSHCSKNFDCHSGSDLVGQAYGIPVRKPNATMTG